MDDISLIGVDLAKEPDRTVVILRESTEDGYRLWWDESTEFSRVTLEAVEKLREHMSGRCASVSWWITKEQARTLFGSPDELSPDWNVIRDLNLPPEPKLHQTTPIGKVAQWKRERSPRRW